MSQNVDNGLTYGSGKNLDKALSPEDNAPEITGADEPSLIALLAGSLAILWKGWSTNMRVTEVSGNWGFSLSGECPYEGDKTVFMIVGAPLVENVGPVHRVVAAMRCQGCLKFILGIALKSNDGVWHYENHYPLGSPDDSVDKHVPPSIAADFSEALRCLWVKSYKATVAMCRRSVEASCKEKNAKGKNLKERIDDLAAQGLITDPLRRMAHRVRLTANEELHGAPDDLDTFTEPEAEGIVRFVREYFHHVYVMPALLDSYNEPQGEAAAKVES